MAQNLALVSWLVSICFLGNLAYADSNQRQGRTLPLNSNTSDYVHSWHRFPTIAGQSVLDDRILRFEPERGMVQVVVFMASWCLPCQQITKDLQKLANDFEDRFVRVIYVFAHDTKADAKGFIDYHKVKHTSIMGTSQLLEEFRQPELPSIFIADRHRWLVMHKPNTSFEDLAEIERFLNLHTAY